MNFFMTDKFGAAMTLVKSDIGGNITVCFCQLFIMTRTWMYVSSYHMLSSSFGCILLCLYRAIECQFILCSVCEFLSGLHKSSVWLNNLI